MSRLKVRVRKLKQSYLGRKKWGRSLKNSIQLLQETGFAYRPCYTTCFQLSSHSYRHTKLKHRDQLCHLASRWRCKIRLRKTGHERILFFLQEKHSHQCIFIYFMTLAIHVLQLKYFQKIHPSSHFSYARFIYFGKHHLPVKAKKIRN